MKKRVLTIALSTILALGLIVAGTLAYMTATAPALTNTFTVGDIEIGLDEPLFPPSRTAKLYPGAEVGKDPTVTVKANSEKSYIYMLLENNLNFTFGDPVQNAITLNIDSTNWTEIATNESGSRKLYAYTAPVDTAATDQALPALFTKVTVNPALTSANIDGLNNKTIEIGAFAHQADAVSEADANAAAKAHFGF